MLAGDSENDAGTCQKDAEAGEGRILGTDEVFGSRNHKLFMAALVEGTIL